jgi:hypothetical protein
MPAPKSVVALLFGVAENGNGPSVKGDRALSDAMAIPMASRGINQQCFGTASKIIPATAASIAVDAAVNTDCTLL